MQNTRAIKTQQTFSKEERNFIHKKEPCKEASNYAI